MATGVDSVPTHGPHTEETEAPTSTGTHIPEVEDQGEQYDMSGLRMAFILCVTVDRDGATNELDILRKSLKDLNFQVTECINPLGKDILNSLEKYRDLIESRDLIKSQVCCSFVFILAHGEEGRIKGTDGEEVDLEEVFETFSNENCVPLQSKPKVFVIQACRGDKKDPGVISGFRSMGSEPEILPTTSDTFIVYPSLPGYVAYRNNWTGSYMIQIMGKVFKMEAGKKHLYDLFVKVNREMVKINFKPKGGKHMKTTLVMESTLTKSIYLKCPKA